MFSRKNKNRGNLLDMSNLGYLFIFTICSVRIQETKNVV